MFSACLDVFKLQSGVTLGIRTERTKYASEFPTRYEEGRHLTDKLCGFTSIDSVLCPFLRFNVCDTVLHDIKCRLDLTGAGCSA